MVAGTTPAPLISRRFASVGSSLIRDLLALTERPGVISFAGGLPAPELFDATGVREAFDFVLSNTPGQALQYSPSEGNARLREIIAASYSALGAPTDASQILITTGSQQGLTLIASALVDPGDVVLVEDPSYLAALQVFGLAGAEILPVPSGEHGIDLDALNAMAGEFAPKLCYVVPTFQNPTGRTFSLEERAGLHDAAERHGFWLIEDDPYRELRYSGTSLPPIASLSNLENVISAGTLSKTVAPGLRIGWLRATGEVRRPLTIAKQAADLHTSTVDQAAAAHYLSSGRLLSHLETMRVEYRRRRDAMLAGLPGALPKDSRFTTPDGGMFVFATLPGAFDMTSLLARAIEHDVAYVPGTAFFIGGGHHNTMRLSFTTYDENAIASGMQRLAKVFSP